MFMEFGLRSFKRCGLEKTVVLWGTFGKVQKHLRRHLELWWLESHLLGSKSQCSLWWVIHWWWQDMNINGHHAILWSMIYLTYTPNVLVENNQCVISDSESAEISKEIAQLSVSKGKDENQRHDNHKFCGRQKRSKSRKYLWDTALNIDFKQQGSKNILISFELQFNVSSSHRHSILNSLWPEMLRKGNIHSYFPITYIIAWLCITAHTCTVSPWH